MGAVKTDSKLENKIGALLTPTLQAMEYNLVRVRLTGSSNKTMQVMVERKDEVNMTVENCAEISQEVSKLLDVSDFISETYTLEISSPGIDRPLVNETDFDRYTGFNAKIEMGIATDGRKRFKGQLLGREDNLVKIRLEEKTFKLPFENIIQAKLLLTEDLFKVVKKRAEG